MLIHRVSNGVHFSFGTVTVIYSLVIKWGARFFWHRGPSVRIEINCNNLHSLAGYNDVSLNNVARILRLCYRPPMNRGDSNDFSKKK